MKKFGIVVSQFNPELTSRLHRGALKTLKRHRVSPTQVESVAVPGAFEIPVAIHQMAISGRYGALIALGAVIQGKTHHYDAICREVARGISETARTTGIPVAFGVIMAKRYADARQRSGEKWNLGAEAAEVAVQMFDIMRNLPCDVAAKRANTR